jgi:hypothetical protein
MDPNTYQEWDGRRDRIQAVIVSLPVRQRDAERCGVMSVSLNIGEALVVAAVHTSLRPGKPT